MFRFVLRILVMNELPGTYFKYTTVCPFFSLMAITLKDVNGIYKYYFYFLYAENYSIGKTLRTEMLLV